MDDPLEITLAAVPYYPNNPWQDIMYADARRRGVEVVELASLDEDWFEQGGAPAVLHVNWTAALSQRAPDILASAAAVRSAIERFEEWRAHGARIIWTVHNVLPHELAYLLPELELCRWLADNADAVMIMNERTGTLVQPWYRLRDDVIHRIPHPSYVGRYPGPTDRMEARRAIGIDDDALAALILGTLRPYKGLDETIFAMPAILRQEPSFRLLVAGERGPGLTETLAAALTTTNGVTARIGYLDAEDVSTWCAAADVMLLPYRTGLNSGVAFLAATFGLPVLATPSDMSEELAGSDWVRVIEGGAALADGIVAGARELAASPIASASASAAAWARRPDAVAGMFTDLIVGLTASRD